MVPRKENGMCQWPQLVPHMDKPTQEEEEEDDEFIGDVQDGQIDMEEIRLAQEEDEVLQEVKRWVEGDPPTEQA